MSDSRSTPIGEEQPPQPQLPETDTPLENAVTPEAVLEMAQYLGIDVESEWDLLWVARECLVEPLPPNWEVRASTIPQDSGWHGHRNCLLVRSVCPKLTLDICPCVIGNHLRAWAAAVH